MIFNTDQKFAVAPITLNGAKDYEGGQLNDDNHWARRTKKEQKNWYN